MRRALPDRHPLQLALAPAPISIPVPTPPVVPVTVLSVISGAPPASTRIPRLLLVRTVTFFSTGALPVTVIPAVLPQPPPSTTTCSSRLPPEPATR